MTDRLRRIILIVVLIPILIGSGLSCSVKSYSGPTDSLTLGVQIQEGTIPIFVAQDQGFFTQNGINLTLKNYDNGSTALNGLLKNEADVVIASDYVFTNRVSMNQDVRAIGSTGKLNYLFVLGRKDHGVTSVSQLAGKKIGIIKGTSLDFFLGSFLTLRGVDINSVKLVNIASFSQLTDALVNGNVDAIISVPPYTDDARSKLGDQVISWPAQDTQMIYILLISKNEWTNGHQALAKRFLKAIDQAEEFINRHPQQAKAIAKKKLDLTDQEVSAIWVRNQFELSLDQSLVLAMEDEARWLIKNHLASETQVPNFLNYISADALKVVKPESVQIAGK